MTSSVHTPPPTTFPKSTGHTRRSHGDWSTSTGGFFTQSEPSTAFSRMTRMSSSSFAVTSVGVPGVVGNAPRNNDEEDAGATSEADSSDSPQPQSRPGLGDRQWSEDDLNVLQMAHDQEIEQRRQKQTHKLRLAQRETRMLRWLRILTLLVFALATSLVSVAVFRSLTQYQDEQLKQVVDLQTTAYLERLEDQLCTHVLQGLEEWQYDYLQDFTVDPSYLSRADSWLQSSGTSWMGMAPLVPNTEVDRTEWELYSQQNAPLWMPQESEELPTLIHPPTISTTTMPLWQHAPFAESAWLNYDLLATNPELSRVIQLDPPAIVMGNWMKLSFDRSPHALQQQQKQAPLVQDMHSTLLYYPIVVNSTITGMVMASIDWDVFLQSFVNELVPGMIIRLANKCQDNYRELVYQVQSNGQLQRLQQMPSGLLQDLAQDLFLTQAMADVPLTTPTKLDTNYCQYQLQVVPTTQVQDYYATRHPAVFTGGIVGVFLFCGLVFVAYDCLVRKRQKKVMKSAAKTHEIVAGLFPEVVRNRLFGESMFYSQKDPKANALTQSVLDDDPKKKSSNNKKKDLDPEQSPAAATSAKLKIASDDELVSPRKPDVLGRGGFLSNSDRTTSLLPQYKDKPIADLFPATTVLFADIAGFTAWSSARDPSQVFTLLETIYAAFDKLAEQRTVFKVETIGDCYVAVTGLPHPQLDHAVMMVKFARDCVKMMQALVQSLETELGPDTSDLKIRVGLHSGPVTAGVLRGQKSRFQLFGDTVNFASRMESNGLPNQIHCSQQTADLLIMANKEHWIHPRKDLVHAKGKGLVQTYWVIGSKPTTSTNASSRRSLGTSSNDMDQYTASFSNIDDDQSDITEEPLDNIHAPHSTSAASRDDEPMDPLEVSPHLQRLIEWNVDMLSKIIKTIVATRDARHGGADLQETVQRIADATSPPPTLILNSNPRNEYVEAIQLPNYDPNRKIKRTSEVKDDSNFLDGVVRKQLKDYITTIACAYNDNPFHNFEHASHVTMSANKLLKRVVNAENVRCRRSSLDNLDSKLHHYTYGITSDPLTHFACLFSSLIHDVDHPGISNAQMLNEKHPLAEVYEGKSIAEQNSFDFAWELLMDAEFDDLRRCLFENETDLQRFRQLVINSILATDVFDPDLVRIRNERWRKAFPGSMRHLGASDLGIHVDAGNDGAVEAPPVETTDYSTGINNNLDLKATVVIEHIIQAADVAHTMQHWHVYQKWNRRLFEEMHAAYKAGKSPVNPADTWYNGELWFYDNYIIPLAKKLRECRVFGPSSDEFLTYALDNKSEWETKGKAIVQDMVAACTHQSEEFLLNQMSKDT